MVFGVATVEYVTQFGFIDATVVVLGPALDGCKAIIRRTADAAREKEGSGSGLMLNKVSLFALSLGLFGLLLVRRALSIIPSFRSVSVAPLL